MPSLLIRDINDSLKRELAVQAACHGRSQQAEALYILEQALEPNKESWVNFLVNGAKSVGGIDLPEVKRHTPRITGVSIS